MKRNPLFPFAFIFVSLLFSSCSEDNHKIPSGTFSLGLSFNSESGSRLSNESEISAVYITVFDSKGNVVLNLEKLPLINLGDDYVTKNVELSADEDYSVEDFIVVNDLDSAIYITPKRGSEFEDVVSTPLPFNFDVFPGDTTMVKLEVVPVNIGTAEQFGYTMFGFDIVEGLSIQPDSISGKDAYVHSFYPDKNYGDHELLQSLSWTISGNEVVLRSFFEFDLGDFPAGSELVKAKLSLYAHHTDAVPSDGHSHLSGSNESLIRRVTSEWTEDSITWNSQPETTSANEVLLPQDTSATQDYVDIDVTDLIRDIIDNPETSHGLMISLVNESSYRAMYFASSNYNLSTKRPKLVLLYK